MSLELESMLLHFLAPWLQREVSLLLEVVALVLSVLLSPSSLVSLVSVEASPPAVWVIL